MTFVEVAIYIGLFMIIIGLIITNIIQKLNYNSETGVYRNKPLKDHLFPPVLPIHRSPPYKPKFSGRYSKSMPVISV
jgi:hypothetical protein